MAWAILVTHWVLLFGWGMALNDTAGGYFYCRIAMPHLNYASSWVFSALVLAVLIFVDASTRNRRQAKWAFYPAALFAITQAVALWISEMSILY